MKVTWPCTLGLANSSRWKDNDEGSNNLLGVIGCWRQVSEIVEPHDIFTESYNFTDYTTVTFFHVQLYNVLVFYAGHGMKIWMWTCDMYVLGQLVDGTYNGD
jgi:hypothetical protein